MMTIHRLHAGDGYTYLTRQVACGDRERSRGEALVDYYHAEGTPAGRWYGAGTDDLGIAGEVTEEQMRALFGEGLHPNADAIIAARLADGASVDQALAAVKLGAAYYQFDGGRTPVATQLRAHIRDFVGEHHRLPTPEERNDLRTDAGRAVFRAEHGRAPTTDELIDTLGADKRGDRKAVAGFDCVFTPQKSVSILWGLGDDDMRRAIAQCHADAVRDTLDHAQERFALTRRGKDGVRQIDAGGFTAAMFDHYDNRTGDMNLHTHVTISTKVRGVDGKWSALDARPLYAGAVSLSTRYNAVLTGLIERRLGWQFVERSHGRGKQPVLEVDGISEAMLSEFSRRAAIVDRTEELVAQYRQIHGRTPPKVVQIKLAQQATLDTRDAKPVPRSLAAMRTEWDQRARTLLGDGRTSAQFVSDLHRRHLDPDAPRPYVRDDVALAVGTALAGQHRRLLKDDPAAVDAAIDTTLSRCPFPDPQARWRAGVEVRAALTDDAVRDRVSAAITTQQRRVYDPNTITADVTAVVEQRRATWTEANIRSAVEERVGVCRFDTDTDHRAAVEHVVARMMGQSIALTVDPDPIPAAMARADGESEFTVHGAARFTSHRVLDREDRLLAAAHAPTIDFLTTASVDAAIATVEKTEKRTLNDGQRDIVRHLTTSGQLLDVAVGPAGTGKTTAMKAVATAWRADGRDVLALAPSSAAARELGSALGTRGRTVESVLAAARRGDDTGITRGAMILVDELGMTDTPALDKLVALAAEHGAVVRGIGDPYQISAVDSGGALRLIAHDTHAPELSKVVRFADEDEAAATLAIRNGDTAAAWEFYSSHDRIRSGHVDELRTQMLEVYLADRSAGTNTIMLAATTADTTALNRAAQAALSIDGAVHTGEAGVELADGLTAHRGDVIVTRLNNRRLRITGGTRKGTGIDNGDLWTVKKVHADGSVTAAGRGHRGTVHLPADYLRNDTELGYASTVHRAQGITVDRALALFNAALGRALGYVAATRGALDNLFFIATDTLPDPALDHPLGGPLEPKDVFASILAREEDNFTATEQIRAEQARIDDPARLRGIHAHAVDLLADARGRHLLDRALPTVLSRAAFDSPHLPDLLATIAAADAHRLDTTALVGALAGPIGAEGIDGAPMIGRDLTGVRDVGAVLRARADKWIAARTPGATDDGTFRATRDLPAVDLPPTPPRHTGTDAELADAVAALADRIRALDIATDDSAHGTGHRPVTPIEREQRHDVAGTPDERERHESDRLIAALRDDMAHQYTAAATWIDHTPRVDHEAAGTPGRPDGALLVAADSATLIDLLPDYLAAHRALGGAAALTAAAEVLTDTELLDADDLRTALGDAHRAGADPAALVRAAAADLGYPTPTDLAEWVDDHDTARAPATGILPDWIPAAPTPTPDDTSAAEAELHAWTHHQHETITARVRDLARATFEENPDWMDRLGPTPEDPAERLRHRITVTHIAAYREQFGITSDEPLGATTPDPGTDHADAHAALTARLAHHSEQAHHAEQRAAADAAERHAVEAERAAEEHRRRQRHAEQHRDAGRRRGM